MTTLDVLMELQDRTNRGIMALQELMDKSHADYLKVQPWETDLADVVLNELYRLQAKEQGMNIIMGYINEAVEALQ